MEKVIWILIIFPSMVPKNYRYITIQIKRLIFIDETWTKTNMTRLRGRAPRGERLIDKVPHGHWKTTTLIAALGISGMRCSTVVDGAVNGDVFEAFVEQVLVPELRRGDVVVMGNLSSLKRGRVRELIEAAGSAAAVLAAVQSRPQSDRVDLRQGEATAPVIGLSNARRALEGDAVRARRSYASRSVQLLQTLRIHATGGLGML